MANIPKELKYTKEHEYVREEGDVVVIGISDYAQGELGDIVFIELPEPGATFQAGDTFGTIEAVKAVSDLYAPIAGEIVEVNSALDNDPAAVNTDPYGAGWMIKMRPADPSARDGVMDAAAYEELLKGA